jgi:hypothetical protein
MTIRVQINLVLYVATAADDSDVRLHVDGGEGIVVGEILDLLLTRLLPLVVLDDDEGVPDHIAVERDVSNITGGIGIVQDGIESGHGQVESLGCYKKLDVRVVRVSITAKKGRVNWNSGKVQEANKKRTWQIGQTFRNRSTSLKLIASPTEYDSPNGSCLHAIGPSPEACMCFTLSLYLS